MNIERATSEDIFWLSLWCWSWKFFIRKSEEILSWIIWKIGTIVSSTWWRF